MLTKLKTRSGVSDLKMDNGNITTNVKEKADTLNNFYSSVFTQENVQNTVYQTLRTEYMRISWNP